jgi:pimeloyl-ACP methyl ester carboxylesterase
VHGNPTHSEDWVPILDQMRGPAIALDLPGFGRSDRPGSADFDYSMRGYARFFRRFLERMAIERYSLVTHDWGCIALIAAEEQPDRVSRLVVVNTLPLLPGYRWHPAARLWRTPVVGELFNRLFFRRGLDLGLRESRGDRSRQAPEFVDLIWDHLDRGTFAAILRLYRSAPPAELEAAGRDLASIEAPALVVWGMKDRYIPARFGLAYAAALPNAELIELPEVGHWPWREDPSVIPRIADFLEG